MRLRKSNILLNTITASSIGNKKTYCSVNMLAIDFIPIQKD